MKSALAVLIALSLLAGCSGLSGPRQAATWYTLDDQGASVPVARVRWGALLVGETEAPEFYQSRALAYSRAAGTRGHYQYAHLTESPAAGMAQAIRRRLAGSGLFGSVADVGSGVAGELRLNTRLLDFYHDAAQAPGEVKLLLEAELVRREDARLLARTLIETSVPAMSHDAAGAARAGNVALTRVLDRLTAWLAGLPQK